MPFTKGHKINVGKFCSSETRKKIGIANSKPRIEILCISCGKQFWVWPSLDGKKKFCSKVCHINYQKGKPTWNKGLKGFRAGITRYKMTEEIKRKISESRVGVTSDENHPAWRGNKVLYRALHSWVERKLGKPNSCEHCKTNGLKGRQIHWANKSGEYKRLITDWIRLCASCHGVYDRN